MRAVGEDDFLRMSLLDYLYYLSAEGCELAHVRVYSFQDNARFFMAGSSCDTEPHAPTSFKFAIGERV